MTQGFRVVAYRHVIETRYIVLPTGEEVRLGEAELDNENALALSETEKSREFATLADLYLYDKLFNAKLTEKGDIDRLIEIEEEYK